MKALLLTSIFIIILAATAFVSVRPKPAPSNPPEPVPASFYDLSVAGIEGDTIRMSDFRGKYVLCVNVASRCGFTPQYKPLQELYERYQDKLVVIGFPCNQFLGQEPGSEAQIAEFCEKNYGVTFLMTEKIKVKGEDQHPVYAWLTDKDINGVGGDKVGWNFHKFLVSPEGRWLASFPSRVDPLSGEITGYLK